MKTSVVFFLLFMLIGGVLGLAILQDPGHVSIRYDDIVVETSLWVSLAMIMVFLLISLALISLTFAF